jgi:SAM-dependent methyltransferase
MRLFPHPKKTKNKLLEEFKGKKILDLSRRFNNDKKTSFLDASSEFHTSLDINHDLTRFPWPIVDNAYDLIVCQHVIEHLPDMVKTLEELNRIASKNGKIFLELPHFTRCEAYRHSHSSHRFAFSSFDFFVKGNPFYKTDFHIENKYLYFDDLTFALGIGFLANLFPRQYEKKLAFMFPATSFQITFQVDK